MVTIVDLILAPASWKPQLREAYGRSFIFNNKPYVLPADVAEHRRLDQLHQLFKLRFNGLVLPEAREFVHVAISSTEKPAILDIGAGSGAWAIDMAALYPKAQVVGIDVAPVNPGRSVPENCAFLLHNANLGLEPYYGQYDVVHCRCVSQGIIDWKDFLAQASACLRPRGVLLIVGPDGSTLLNESRERITELVPGKAGFSHFNRMVRAARAVEKRSRGTSETSHLHTLDWLKAMDGRFNECSRGTYLVPIGAWDNNLSENDKAVAELQRQSCATLINSFRPALMASGTHPPEEVDEIIDGARDEVENVRFKQYIQWYGVWAVRA